MKRVLCILFAASLPAFFEGCATVGTVSPPDDALPSSGAGPFRKLSATEMQGVAPYVLDDPHGLYREPSALALDGTDSNGVAASMRVALFFTATTADGHAVIDRTHAEDARSFYGAPLDGHKPQQVLAADQSWEGADLAAPSVLASGGTIYLYYAASGGVGLATSSDGFAFTKKGAPVLAPDASVKWETEVPSSPSVAVLPSGEFRMLYSAGPCIGEAKSADGTTFTRLDADPSTPDVDPVLCPSAIVSEEAIDAGTQRPFDTARVGDPHLFPRVTAAGRLQFRVLYTGTAATNGTTTSAIGFAARYGDTGRLVKNAAPVYAVNKHEHAPTTFTWATGEMLYVTQDETPSSGAPYPAIAAAFSPAQDTLPTPNGYADGP